jgi:hypothetical protein
LTERLVQPALHAIRDTFIWNVVQDYRPPLKVAIAAIEEALKKQS